MSISPNPSPADNYDGDLLPVPKASAAPLVGASSSVAPAPPRHPMHEIPPLATATAKHRRRLSRSSAAGSARGGRRHSSRHRHRIEEAAEAARRKLPFGFRMPLCCAEFR